MSPSKSNKQTIKDKEYFDIIMRDNFDLALEANELVAESILGDGNCLYRAISDQLYGTQARHAEIRAKAIEYMRSNQEDFAPYFVVGAGANGEYRRAPSRASRKDKAPLEDLVDSETPEVRQRYVNTSYNQCLDQRAKDGVYGDHHEMVAIAKAYGIIVRIIDKPRQGSQKIHETVVAECDIPTPFTKVAKIIHHKWEHFSSVRPNRPVTGFWLGLYPQKNGPKVKHIAPIDQPNKASLGFSGTGKPSSIKVPSKHLPIQGPTPPFSPTTTGTSQKAATAPRSAPASLAPAATKQSQKPVTSRLTVGAGVSKVAKLKTKTFVTTTTGAPMYKYPGGRICTRTGMRMLGMQAEIDLFKRVEKNADGTPKEYSSNQKYTTTKVVPA